MKCNVGGLDKTLRIVIGVAVIAYGIVSQNWLGLLGIIPLLTGLFSFCPFYPIFGINTGCKRN